MVNPLGAGCRNLPRLYIPEGGSAVIMMTGGAPGAFLMCSSTWMPFTSGMRTSSRMRLGASCWDSVMPGLPPGLDDLVSPFLAFLTQGPADEVFVVDN